MTYFVERLIDKLMENDLISAKQNFNRAISEKVLAKLESKKVELSKKMIVDDDEDDVEENSAFMGKAAAAKKDGKKKFKLGDKEFPVTMKKSTAEKILDETVSSSSKDNYRSATGKKPSGKGKWAFSTVKPFQHDIVKHKDQTFISPPFTSFVDAAKLAAKHFKEKGHKGEIHVLP